MAAPVTTMQAGWQPFQVTPVAPLFNVVCTTNVTTAAATQNQMVFTAQEAVVVRPPYNYGFVAG